MEARGSKQTTKFEFAEETKLTPQHRDINWIYMTPLVFAPLLPLIRIGLRKHPELRNKVFISAVFVGLAHGTFLIMRASEEEANLTKRETARAEAAKAAAKAAVPRE